MSDQAKKAAKAAYMRKWRKDNPNYAGKMRGYRATWRDSNPELERQTQREYARKLRIEILNLLGGAFCVRCGFNDLRALHIDHVNGDRRADTRSNQNAEFFRKWIKNHPVEARQIYQVLCANCNFIKAIENKEHHAYRTERPGPIVVPWAPRGEVFVFNGKTRTLREWSDETGISLKALQARIREQGWSIEDALTIPSGRGLSKAHRKDLSTAAKHMPLTFRGESLPLYEWAERQGLKWKTVWDRIRNNGWSVEDALTQAAYRGRNKRDAAPEGTLL